MLRLTTNVTVSPASSARSSIGGRSASPRSPRAAARRTAPSAPPRSAPARRAAFAIARGASVVGDRDLGAAARAAARDERPVAPLDHVQHRLRDPLRVDVLRVDAQPLGQREPVSLAAACGPGRRRERMLGRDVVAVRAQPAEVGRPGARPARATSRTGSAAPGSRRPASAAAPRATSRFMSSIVTSHAHAGASAAGRPRRPCASTRAPPRRRSRAGSRP